MTKTTKSSIQVKGSSINVLSKANGDYISLTDMVRNFDGGSALIEQWLKNKDTVLFLGVWEQINNPRVLDRSASPRSPRNDKLAKFHAPPHRMA